MHVRFLLVEGKKMSKSGGQLLHPPSDLLLKGYRGLRHPLPAHLRPLPQPDQLHLRRLDRIHQRHRSTAHLPPAHPQNHLSLAGLDEAIAAATAKAEHDYTAALAHDLNTAEARAAIFDLVRAANSAADHGTLRADNVKQILAVLQLFDGVFAVLEDNDAAITRAALDWAEKEGRIHEAAPELLNNLSLSDADIDALVAERTQAKKSRNFARADAIRNDLLAKGILIEDSKEGVRWKRK